MPGSPPKRKYRLITGIYSEQLNDIWAKDQRIPSHASRKAWAVARGLNPQSVHNWWYRRRPRAKKLKIRIPSGTYELEVGIVPTPPPTPPQKVKEEVQEPSISIEPVTENDPGNNAKEDNKRNEVVPVKEAAVCGQMDSDGLRLWTEHDELEELRSSMRPSSPLSSSSYSHFPSSDLDRFFQPAPWSAVAPSTPGFEPSELCSEDDAPLATASLSRPDIKMELDDKLGGFKKGHHLEPIEAPVDSRSLPSGQSYSINAIYKSTAAAPENAGTCFFREHS